MSTHFPAGNHFTEASQIMALTDNVHPSTVLSRPCLLTSMSELPLISVGAVYPQFWFHKTETPMIKLCKP